MKKLPTWASLAIVSYEQKFGYAIETIFIDSQTCTLSGAWDFETLEDTSILNILSNRLIITTGLKNGKELEQRFACRQVSLNTFISDSDEIARESIDRFEKYIEENANQYSEYMLIPSTERKLIPKVIKKKLEPIHQHSWKISFDELRPELTLKQLEKRDSINGTPANMKRLIATAWLTKHLVDRWREDELERTSRPYLYPDGKEFQILPSSWLNCLNDLQGTVKTNG